MEFTEEGTGLPEAQAWEGFLSPCSSDHVLNLPEEMRKRDSVVRYLGRACTLLVLI
jgi:hypothetical protein